MSRMRQDLRQLSSNSLLSPAADSYKQKQALRGLAIYFIVLVPLSMVFQTLMILGHLSWLWALMWTPAVASVVARLALREGFGDVSFRIGRHPRIESYLICASLSNYYWADFLWHSMDNLSRSL